MFEKYIKWDNFSLPIILFLLTIITRIPFTSKYLYHMDSVQFALALDKFDVTIHQPHPPGYFLYVMLGRLLNIFIHDANTVFVVISIFFSALAVIVIYFLGKEMFDGKTAILAAVLAVTSPNFWFHGEVALSYTVEAFVSSFIALLCWRIYNGERYLIFLSIAALAIAGGIRQNTPVFMAPLWFFSVKDIPYRRIIAVLALFLLLSLCWFIPMVVMTGGSEKYFSALRELWSIAGTHSSVFWNGWDAFRLYADIIFNYIVYSIGGGIAVIFFALYYVVRNRRFVTLRNAKIVFLSLWILPILAFHLLITPGIPGHMLIILPPLIILISGTITYINEELAGLPKNGITLTVIPILVIINLYIFLVMRYPVSYAEIRDHDKNLPIIIGIIKKYDPLTTVLLLDYNYRFYSFIHIMYYLPEYTIYEPRIRNNPSGKLSKFFGKLDGKVLTTDKIILPSTIKNFATIIISIDLTNGCCKSKAVTIWEAIPDYFFVSGLLTQLNEVYPKLQYTFLSSS